MSLSLAVAAVPGHASERPSDTPPVPALPQGWTVCIGDATAPPFVTGNPQQPGVTERLLIDAGLKVGLRVQLLRWPTERCRESVRSGKVDAGIGAPVPKNLEAGLFPMAGEHVDRRMRVATLRLVWVKRKNDAWAWDGHQFSPDLRPKVGLRSGFKAGSTLLDALALPYERNILSSTQVLRMLHLKRIDLGLLLEEEALAAMAKLPEAEQMALLPKPAQVSDFYPVMSRALPEGRQSLGRAWFEAIGQLREQPAYQP